jgi:protein-tyrosine-phosphatase
VTDPLRVLVLCTGNSARSILGEALINRLGAGRVVAHSAGSQPKGEPHPEALRLLLAKGYDVSGLRSKSWDEFAGADAPRIDLIITVCDSAAAESCPVWPGGPVTVHWGIADPAAVTSSPAEVAAAFAVAYAQLERRVTAFLALPRDSLDRLVLKTRMDEIGRTADAGQNV